MTEVPKIYLGDGLYAEYRGAFEIVTYCSNGLRKWNEQVWDIGMVEKFQEFVHAVAANRGKNGE